MQKRKVFSLFGHVVKKCLQSVNPAAKIVTVGDTKNPNKKNTMGLHIVKQASCPAREGRGKHEVRLEN